MTIQRQVGWIERSEINEMRNLECELADEQSGNKFINKFKEIFALKKKHEKKGNSEIKVSTKINKAGLDFFRNIIIFKNINMHESNIYHIDGSGCITQHYKTKAKMHNFIKRTPKTVDILYCCWHRHRAVLSLLSAFLPAVTVKYMLKPHNCLGQCTCCCKNKPGMSDKPRNSAATIFEKTYKETTSAAIAEIDMETHVTPLTLKVLEKNMLNHLSKTNLIQKAFAHTLHEKPKLKNNTSEVDKILSFKETQILFNYDKSNDYYRLGREGDIIQHFRNVSQTFIDKQVMNEMNGKKTINEKVCCSIKRDKLIHSFRKNKMRLDTYKYIKTRSKLMDKPQCHCKPLQPSPNITGVTFKKLNITDVPNHTREFCYKMPPINFMFAKHVPTVAKNVVHTDRTEDKIQKIRTGASTGPSANKTSVQNINNDNNKHVSVIGHDEAQRRMLICIDTKILLENSLDRLNNISVVINNQSKITVTLNIPITDLTTNELKILSVILNEAQKEVDTLRQEVVFNKEQNNAVKNVVRPTYLNPVESNNITDKIQTSKCSGHMRHTLYAAFSLCSRTQNEGYLKSLKAFLKIKYNNKSPKILLGRTLNVDNRGSTTSQIPRRRKKRSSDATEQTDKELQKKKPRLRTKNTAPDQITEMQEELEIELSKEECLKEEMPEILQPGVIDNINIKSEIHEQIPTVSQDDVDPIATIDFDSNNVSTEGGALVLKVENMEGSAMKPDNDDCILGI